MGETAKVFVPLDPDTRVPPGREFDVPDETLVWLGEGRDRVAVGRVVSAVGAPDGDGIHYMVEFNDDVTVLADASLGGFTIDGPRPPGVAKG